MSAIIAPAPAFAGVFQAINPANEWERPRDEEVMDDVEGEQETMPDHEPQDELVGEIQSEGFSADGGQMSQLKGTLLHVSKGVSEGTDGEYRR